MSPDADEFLRLMLASTWGQLVNPGLGEAPQILGQNWEEHISLGRSLPYSTLWPLSDQHGPTQSLTL